MGSASTTEVNDGSGVTTNSESGVSDLETFYATFAPMEQHGMGMSVAHPTVVVASAYNVCPLVLNLHGEVLESLAPPDTTLEEAFLPTLKSLHERFPQLRIVVRISAVPLVETEY